MLNDKEFVLETMKKAGLNAATNFQVNSVNMTGTKMYEQEEYIPDFQEARLRKNMLERKAGMTDGFICLSTAGRVVRLIQNYDSNIYTQEPEELPAQWGFKWSTDPTKALPFIALSTSPYMTDDCCTFNEHVWRSGQDNNVWEPGSVGVSWSDLGTIDDVMMGVIPTPDEPTIEPEPDPEPEEPDIPSYPDFVQPTGAHDAYQTGDIVNYNGVLYKSKIDNNVWSPDVYPAGWEVYVT